MAVLEIITYGNPLLREKSKLVETLTPELKALAADMGETMYARKGIGLAAPQIGVSSRLIVLDVNQLKDNKSSEKNRQLRIFYNPEIVSASAEDCALDEGCLSVPSLDGEVYRPARILFRGLNEKFDPVEFEARDMLARVIQHEIDHIDGILFIDRLSKTKRLTLAGRLASLRKKAKAQGGPVVI